MESLEIISNSQNADIKEHTDKIKDNNTDIICALTYPYLPSRILGNVEEIYIKSIDYMVGMNKFEDVFHNLGISNNCYIQRENKIYKVIRKKILNKVNRLSVEDIINIGKYTNRIESDLYTMVGFDSYVLKHQKQTHIQYMLEDIKNNVLHKYIELEYLKSNLIIHLKPRKCMEEKGIPYNKALSYCISIMWATLISIVSIKAENTGIIDLLKRVFHDLNPIATKMEIHSIRTLTPNGYSFMQEFSQLTSANKFIVFKYLTNRVIVRWSPHSDRFENAIYETYRKKTSNWDDIELLDDRADNNGKRFVKYDCRIDKGKLITKITVVGQNRMRDVTGYRTTPIYGLLCDADILEDYELSSLFKILTGTKEHKKDFNLTKAYMDIKARKVVFLTFSDLEDFDDLTDIDRFDSENNETLETVLNSTPEEIMKCKYRKTLADIYLREEQKKEYTQEMVTLAVRRLNKKVFLSLNPNNNLYIATQLIEQFNMKRNVPKDVMTVLKFAKLSEEELLEKLNLVERHKRPRIKEMVEFVKTLEPPKHILHLLYNYLWTERYV